MNLNQPLMTFIADLHIHSRFAYATSKSITLQQLNMIARQKGIKLLGTGDALHPQWLAELEEQLKPDGNGFYVLKEKNAACSKKTRFIPTVEISSIYRQQGRVRKIHSLVVLPDFSAVHKLRKQLAAIGNLASDGRPILKLSARELLEMVLQTDDQALLIPAHIWTPWFSLFGARSGFDHLSQCFGDLSPYITCVETGLSSDVPMNRMVGQLNSIRLISNSDAHSAQNLGRNATIFYGSLSYKTVYQTLTRGVPGKDLATIDMYPQQGKYYLDGHRKCEFYIDPEEADASFNSCPVCGKPRTPGVLGRVLQLAKLSENMPNPITDLYHYNIPLREIIGQVYKRGSASKTVTDIYHQLLQKLGPELDILLFTKLDALQEQIQPALLEAISKLRAGKARFEYGYDGKFGYVKV